MSSLRQNQIKITATARFVGRITLGAGDAEELTGTQATSLLDPMLGATGTVAGSKGLVPPPAATDNLNFLRGDGTWQPVSSNTGTVTSVSVTTANGVSGTVANATTAPAISITLGAITPSSVAATGSVTGSNLSGTNTGDQTITLTGDVTGSGTGSFAATIGNNKVTFAKLVAATQAAFVGATAAGNFTELTGATATTLLSAFAGATGSVAGTKGLVPAPSTANYTANAYLKADGTWSQVAYSQVSGTPSLAAIATSGSAADLTTGTLLAARMPAHTGDVTSTVGSVAMTIAPAAVTLAKMANLGANTIIGNNTGAAATPLALTGTQVTAMLNTFTATLKGLVPAPTTSTGKFLKDDGSWAVAGGTTTNLLTINNAGTGAASGSTFDGSSALTISYNTIGAAAASHTHAYTDILTVPTATFLGRNSAGTGAAEAMSVATAKSLLGLAGTNSGDQTITLTGDVTGTGTGSFAATIAANAVTYGKMQAATKACFVGATGAGVLGELTGAQAAALLPNFTSTAAGLVPLSGGGTTNFLRADGTWAAPPAGGGTVADGNYGDITVTSGVWTINGGAVVLSDIAAIANSRILGNNSGGSASPSALTGAQVTALLSTVVANGAQGVMTGADKAKLDGIADGATANSAAVTFNNSGSGAASGTTFDGTVARTISCNTIGASPEYSSVVNFTAARTIGAGDNNNYLKFTGSTARTITMNATPSAGFSCIVVNRGTVNLTLSCTTGIYKNGAGSTATTGTITPGGKVTLFHEGSGVWTADGPGLT